MFGDVNKTTFVSLWDCNVARSHIYLAILSHDFKEIA